MIPKGDISVPTPLGLAFYAFMLFAVLGTIHIVREVFVNGARSDKQIEAQNVQDKQVAAE